MHTRRKEKLILLAIDFVMSLVVFFAYYLFRFKTGVVENPVPLFLKDVPIPALTVSVGWVLLFWFAGLYRFSSPVSRFDETVSISKVVSIGCLVLFVLTVQPSAAISAHRLILVIYWLAMVFGISGARVGYRTWQRRRLAGGKGLQPSIVVGWNDRARDIASRLSEFPALGYSVEGFVTTRSEEVGERFGELGVLGHVSQMPQLIRELGIQEVILALSSNDHERMLEIIDHVNGEAVGIKIIPDLYDIISGQARTNQIYGFPLIEILPELMPAWERSAKRVLDITVSILVLTVLSPLWLLVAILIKLESPGPVIYRQERVGKDGRHFNINKFRSMKSSAEAETGPVWASEDDPRITAVGRVLRNLRIDEVPQFVNVLLGEMSLVGPRPERPFFVEKIEKELPIYRKRYRIRPGITGWAQIKHKYDATYDDVKRKLRYDLFYIENMSLRMDFKIIFSTIRVMLSGKGH